MPAGYEPIGGARRPRAARAAVAVLSLGAVAALYEARAAGVAAALESSAFSLTVANDQYAKPPASLGDYAWDYLVEPGRENVLTLDGFEGDVSWAVQGETDVSTGVAALNGFVGNPAYVKPTAADAGQVLKITATSTSGATKTFVGPRGNAFERASHRGGAAGRDVDIPWR